MSAAALAMALCGQAAGGCLMERLGRGLVAIERREGGVYVGWRLLGTDPPATAFNLYRSREGKAARLNDRPIADSTNFVDAGGARGDTYVVRPVLDGREQAPSESVGVLPQGHLTIPLRGDLPYGALAVGVGDLDGDGEYDFVVKRGAGSVDPGGKGQPRGTYQLEGYRRDGTFLWRVELGVNIRPGIWYAPFIIYDFDGDGRAEVAAKFGEVDEDWNGDGRLDYRSDARTGRVLTGPEYLVVLDGQTGRIRARADWIERGEVGDWGDTYGNRANRNLMAVAYLDGQAPSLLVFRGTYTKMYAEAWRLRGGALRKLWRWFRPGRRERSGLHVGGGGFHNLRIGDIDGDGRDEVVNGSIAIDDDGKTLWCTGEGHGDRMHMTDIDPDRPGKEIWYIQEEPKVYRHAVHLRDARTGELIWGHGDGTWGDVGRGLAGDIDPRHRGMECWAASKSMLYTSKGQAIGPRPAENAAHIDFMVWWDGDLLREHLSRRPGLWLGKWNWEQHRLEKTLAFPDVDGGIGFGDVLGDWREEVWYVAKLGNGYELRVCTTAVPTRHRLWTLMHDPDYRTSVACETMGYLQPAQPSFYLGVGMAPQPPANVATPEE